jgi:hypothetical protein
VPAKSGIPATNRTLAQRYFMGCGRARLMPAMIA